MTKRRWFWGLALALILALLAVGVAWAARSMFIQKLQGVGTIEWTGGNFQETRAAVGTSDYTIAQAAGLGRTGGMGKLPLAQMMDAVPAADATAVLGATAIPTGEGEYTDVTEGITDPTVYRALSITSAGAAALSDVIIYGTDWAGRTISDTIAGGGAATVDGNKPFKTVTKVRIYGVEAPDGAEYSVGISEKLGLYRPILLDTDVVQINLKATADTSWTVTAAGALPAGAEASATYGTVDPETTITAGDGYVIFYNASAW